MPLPDVPAAPTLLVAGCGTGAELLALARRIRDVRITALDLSRASLGYARRKAELYGCEAVEFVQGDILNLPDLDRQFDVVYSTGVVHHMRDPAAGVRRLAERLRPGGLLKLGFYSERARGPIRDAKAAIAAGGFDATPDGIRAFRRHVLDLPSDAPLRQLLRWRDFFSLSECRDMLFHVQDHEFRLPAAGALLRDAGLEVLGLSRRLPPGALQAYQARFPGDEAAADLERWDSVEESHPNLFAGMFHVWARRR
jgi:SAM-dependent methyltransferase